MPLVETLPVTDRCAQWQVWSTVARIVVTDPGHLKTAEAIVRSELSAVDAACSRFRADSELERAARAGGRPVTISARLAELVQASLDAAEATDGDVTPTLGAALVHAGYDRDFASIGGAVHGAAPGAYQPVDWRRIRLDDTTLTLPEGVRLDLGATAKAWAADRCANLIAARCGTGVLVSLGGDIATAGPRPDGWDILVQDGPSEPAATVSIPAGAAIATSSTIARRWTVGDRELHHILDPRTGAPAVPVWRTVSVVAGTCVAANTASTAAIVRGEHARDWLCASGLAARLVDAGGSIRLVGGWPAEAEVANPDSGYAAEIVEDEIPADAGIGTPTERGAR